MKYLLSVLAGLVIALGVFSGPAEAEDWVVQMQNFRFVPDTLTIAEGDSVTWVNEDGVVHTSTSGINCAPDGRWNSGDMPQGATYGYRFLGQGGYPYFCIPHCLGGMVGSIIVTPNTPIDEKTWGKIKALYRR